MLSADYSSLMNYERLGHDAQLAIPTPEHFLPLLYLLGMRRSREPVSFAVSGFGGGLISMPYVRVG